MDQFQNKNLGRFDALNPDVVLDSVDKLGYVTTAHLTQLNSYENRVFEVGVENILNGEDLGISEDPNKLIAKFYRPNRWSEASILEEHSFLQELKKEGIPAVAPILSKDRKSLHLTKQGLFYALFPKIRARMPQEISSTDLKKIGKRLAQLHNVGARKVAHHRPGVGVSGYGGWDNLEFLNSWISPEVRDRYVHAAEEILFAAQDLFDPSTFVRIHGDCHRGNLLDTGTQENNEFFLIDFDDFVNGPPVQDFWMLVDFDDPGESEKVEALIDGYEELREFDHQSRALIKVLQGQRLIGYSAWIAARWKDPSFPRIFPEFGNYLYWAEETESIERIAHHLSS